MRGGPLHVPITSAVSLSLSADGESPSVSPAPIRMSPGPVRLLPFQDAGRLETKGGLYLNGVFSLGRALPP